MRKFASVADFHLCLKGMNPHGIWYYAVQGVGIKLSADMTCRKFRRWKNWTQEELTAKMQLLGCYMTRDLLDSIETGRCPATEKQIMYFAEVFGVEAYEIFKQEHPKKRQADHRPVK
jgi:hypothetical protein